MFKRKAYEKLLDWKKTSAGKTALLVEGARRVGKSTLVKEFAKNEYASHILIDFAYAPQNVHDLFDDLSDLDYFFLQLQLQYGVDLHQRDSLIIFDEVQFNPRARQAIKLLVADGRYDYIETGSLISIQQNVKNILIPSEERKMFLYPFDFEEFLWATGDEVTVKLLQQMFASRKPLGDAQNRNMMRKMRLYMLVGGMPQAVVSYVETNNFRVVDQVKREILSLYYDDFQKIDPKGKISHIFNGIPAELNKHSQGYQVSSVLPQDRLATIEEEIAQLIASRTVLPAYNVSDPQVGLSYSSNRHKFKLFFADTGLLVTQLFWDNSFTDNVIYAKLLSDKLPANLGIVYENLVAQTLAAAGHKLYFHTFRDPEARKTYEIDFLITEKDKISAIEVKSSGYKAHKSLDVFVQKYSSRIRRKIVLSKKDLATKSDTLYIPLYLAMFLK